MIHPAIVNLSAIQGSTFDQDLTITGPVHDVDADDNTNLFICLCHEFSVGDRVVFAPAQGELPCGIADGAAYYVIADGLTDDTFKISLVLNGSPVSFHLTGNEAGLKVGKAVDLTFYTLNAYIKVPEGESLLQAFTCLKTDSASGRMRLILNATTTGKLGLGNYRWVLELSTAQYQYFYATGVFTLEAS